MTRNLSTGTIIASLILGTLALGFYVISCLHFLEKGLLLNNAYLYASKGARETLSKRPYYRQSGTVFAMLGTIFAINTADVLWQTSWLFFVSMAMMFVTIVYAVISSASMEKRKNDSR